MGIGGAEELFDPQVWMNFDIITMTNMLKQASKVIHITDDPAFANRNRTLDDAENGEIFPIEQGRTVQQINTIPVNITVFENSIKEWQAHAQLISAAHDPILGIQPPSGTSGILQDFVVAQAQSTHDYRRGKLASNFEEIYMDWFLPMISRELRKGYEFLSELDTNELKEIQEKVVQNNVNKMIAEKILSGNSLIMEEIESYRELLMAEFEKNGSKWWLKILEGELKDIPLKIKVNVAGKQKNIGTTLVKVLGIFQDVFRNPQLLENPQMSDLLNQILESAGLSPINWSNFKVPQEVSRPPVSIQTNA